MAYIVKFLHGLVFEMFARGLLLEIHLKLFISFQKVLEILIILIVFGITVIGLVVSIVLLFISSPIIVPGALLFCLALMPFFAFRSFAFGLSMLFLFVIEYSKARIKVRVPDQNITRAETPHTNALENQGGESEITNSNEEGTSDVGEIKKVPQDGTSSDTTPINAPENKEADDGMKETPSVGDTQDGKKSESTLLSMVPKKDNKRENKELADGYGLTGEVTIVERKQVDKPVEILELKAVTTAEGNVPSLLKKKDKTAGGTGQENKRTNEDNLNGKKEEPAPKKDVATRYTRSVITIGLLVIGMILSLHIMGIIGKKPVINPHISFEYVVWFFTIMKEYCLNASQEDIIGMTVIGLILSTALLFFSNLVIVGGLILVCLALMSFFDFSSFPFLLPIFLLLVQIYLKWRTAHKKEVQGENEKITHKESNTQEFQGEGNEIANSNDEETSDVGEIKKATQDGTSSETESVNAPGNHEEVGTQQENEETKLEGNLNEVKREPEQNKEVATRYTRSIITIGLLLIGMILSLDIRGIIGESSKINSHVVWVFTIMKEYCLNADQEDIIGMTFIGIVLSTVLLFFSDSIIVGGLILVCLALMSFFAFGSFAFVLPIFLFVILKYLKGRKTHKQVDMDKEEVQQKNENKTHEGTSGKTTIIDTPKSQEKDKKIANNDGDENFAAKDTQENKKALRDGTRNQNTSPILSKHKDENLVEPKEKIKKIDVRETQHENDKDDTDTRYTRFIISLKEKIFIHSRYIITIGLLPIGMIFKPHIMAVIGKQSKIILHIIFTLVEWFFTITEEYSLNADQGDIIWMTVIGIVLFTVLLFFSDSVIVGGLILVCLALMLFFAFGSFAFVLPIFLLVILKYLKGRLAHKQRGNENKIHEGGKTNENTSPMVSDGKTSIEAKPEDKELADKETQLQKEKKNMATQNTQPDNEKSKEKDDLEKEDAAGKRVEKGKAAPDQIQVDNGIINEGKETSDDDGESRENKITAGGDGMRNEKSSPIVPEQKDKIPEDSKQNNGEIEDDEDNKVTLQKHQNITSEGSNEKTTPIGTPISQGEDKKLSNNDGEDPVGGKTNENTSPMLSEDKTSIETRPKDKEMPDKDTELENLKKDMATQNTQPDNEKSKEKDEPEKEDTSTRVEKGDIGADQIEVDKRIGNERQETSNDDGESRENKIATGDGMRNGKLSPSVPEQKDKILEDAIQKNREILDEDMWRGRVMLVPPKQGNMALGSAQLKIKKITIEFESPEATVTLVPNLEEMAVGNSQHMWKLAKTVSILEEEDNAARDTQDKDIRNSTKTVSKVENEDNAAPGTQPDIQKTEHDWTFKFSMPKKEDIIVENAQIEPENNT